VRNLSNLINGEILRFFKRYHDTLKI
jgi:hypothetical protein